VSGGNEKDFGVEGWTRWNHVCRKINNRMNDRGSKSISSIFDDRNEKEELLLFVANENLIPSK